jgi:hypothetical protein
VDFYDILVLQDPSRIAFEPWNQYNCTRNPQQRIKCPKLQFGWLKSASEATKQSHISKAAKLDERAIFGIARNPAWSLSANLGLESRQHRV